MSSASSKLRRVRLFISARGRPSLHAATSYQRAATYSNQNLPRHTRSLLAQMITAMNVPSELLRTSWKLGGRQRGGMVAVARNGKECTRRELVWRMALRGGLYHALLNSHDSESNQLGRSTRIACFYQALVSHWIWLVSRWIRLASTNQEEAHESCVSFKRLRAVGSGL